MRVKVKVQVYCGDAIALGPGKVELLEGIVQTGSIAAAARDLEMSYRRAWLLVDTMNRCFAQPLVATRPGGGAEVTADGQAVICAYRDMAAKAEAAVASPDAIISRLRPTPISEQR